MAIMCGAKSDPELVVEHIVPAYLCLCFVSSSSNLFELISESDFLKQCAVCVCVCIKIDAPCGV